MKPPQKPTAIRRYKVFDDAGISKPMMKEPMMLTKKIANSLQMHKCVKRQVIKERVMLPNAPPVPTIKMFFIISPRLLQR